MKQKNIIQKLEGTKWTDTYSASMCEIEINNIKEKTTSNMDTYQSVELQRNKLKDRDMFSIDFLDYIAYGRFIPENSEAEYIVDIINCSTKFPTI